MTFLKQGLLLAGALVLMFALPFHALQRDLTESGITETEPVVVDFDRIMERGSIRVITRYNSMTYFVQNGAERGLNSNGCPHLPMNMVCEWRWFFRRSPNTRSIC